MFNEQARIKELETLVDQLKATNHQQKTQHIQNIRQSFEQYAHAAIGFLEREQETSKMPYLFVDKKGKILGYTTGLANILQFSEDMRGKDYTEIFKGYEDNKAQKEIRKYFSSEKEIRVTYEAKINNKKKTLKVTKEVPVKCEGIDFSSIGRTNKRDVIAFVPIKIEVKGAFSRQQGPNLTKLLKDLELGNMKEIYQSLVMRHGWSAKQIQQYEKLHGLIGIKEQYQELEHS